MPRSWGRVGRTWSDDRRGSAGRRRTRDHGMPAGGSSSSSYPCRPCCWHR